MNVVKTLSVYLVGMQASWKMETYKKLKKLMLKHEWTPVQFAKYCDQEIERIITKSRLQVKRIQQKQQ